MAAEWPSNSSSSIRSATARWYCSGKARTSVSRSSVAGPKRCRSTMRRLASAGSAAQDLADVGQLSQVGAEQVGVAGDVDATGVVEDGHRQQLLLRLADAPLHAVAKAFGGVLPPLFRLAEVVILDRFGLGEQL